MKIDLTKKEWNVILSCLTTAEESINNNILIVNDYDRGNIGKSNIDDLYIKIQKNLLFNHTHPKT